MPKAFEPIVERVDLDDRVDRLQSHQSVLMQIDIDEHQTDVANDPAGISRGIFLGNEKLAGQAHEDDEGLQPIHAGLQSMGRFWVFL